MDADADALAADIICSLRGADLAGWTPPWCKPAPREGELIWPPVARGKRSRRRSPSAGPAAAAKGRWGRGSPASPLDYSGGSGSGGSTSGGDDGGGFCSPGHRLAPATKVRGFSRHPRTSLSSAYAAAVPLWVLLPPPPPVLSLSYPLFSF